MSAASSDDESIEIIASTETIEGGEESAGGSDVAARIEDLRRERERLRKKTEGCEWCYTPHPAKGRRFTGPNGRGTLCSRCNRRWREGAGPDPPFEGWKCEWCDATCAETTRGGSIRRFRGPNGRATLCIRCGNRYAQGRATSEDGTKARPAARGSPEPAEPVEETQTILVRGPKTVPVQGLQTVRVDASWGTDQASQETQTAPVRGAETAPVQGIEAVRVQTFKVPEAPYDKFSAAIGPGVKAEVIVLSDDDDDDDDDEGEEDGESDDDDFGITAFETEEARTSDGAPLPRGRPRSAALPRPKKKTPSIFGRRKRKRVAAKATGNKAVVGARVFQIPKGTTVKINDPRFKGKTATATAGASTRPFRLDSRPRAGPGAEARLVHAQVPRRKPDRRSEDVHLDVATSARRFARRARVRRPPLGGASSYFGARAPTRRESPAGRCR